MNITQEIIDAAFALKIHAETSFVTSVPPVVPDWRHPDRVHYRDTWTLGRIHPVAIHFAGKMELIGGKTFGGIGWTHWDGNQRYQISMPNFDRAAYHRLRKFVWQQQGYDPDGEEGIIRDPHDYRFTIDGMYNEVTPEFADKHPFGQRWLGLWEWTHVYQSSEWNMIHSIDYGAHVGEPRKYKEREFDVQFLVQSMEVV